MVDDPATATAGGDPAAAATSEDPITGLRAVRSLRELAERLETLQVARARQLGLSWQEIADALRYASAAYFSARFKSVTGMTPGAFRRLGGCRRKPLDEV